MKRDQPALLVLTGGQVLQHPHQDLAEGAARLTGAAPGVVGPVEAVHFKAGLVLASGVSLDVAATRFLMVANPCPPSCLVP